MRKSFYISPTASEQIIIKNEMKKLINKFKNLREIADKFKITPSNLSKFANLESYPTIEIAIYLETKTNKFISRKKLCPQYFRKKYEY